MLLVGIGFALRPTDAILFAFTQPYLALFLAGLIIGLVHEKLVFRPNHLLLIGLAALFVLSTFAGNIKHGSVLIAAAAVATVLGAAGMGQQSTQTPRFKLLGFIGDASYALYLSHTFVFPNAVASASHISSALSMSVLLFLPIVLALCVSLSIAINVLFERPLIALLRNAFRLGSSAKTGADLAAAKASLQ